MDGRKSHIKSNKPNNWQKSSNEWDELTFKTKDVVSTRLESNFNKLGIQFKEMRIKQEVSFVKIGIKFQQTENQIKLNNQEFESN